MRIGQLLPGARNVRIIVGTTAMLSGAFSCTAPAPPDAQTARAVDARDIGTLALFGYKVALGSQVLAVGAPHASVGDHDKAGAVLVFDRSTLELIRRVEAPSPAPGALFGFAVSLREERLLVGAVGERINDHEFAGAAYLFNVRTGQLQRKLVESHSQSRAEFGSALGFVGPDPVVTSPASDARGKENSGQAYRFDESTAQVRVRYHLPTPETHSVLGQSIAATTTTVLIGAPAAPAGDTLNAGAVFAFEPETAALQRRLEEPSPGYGNGFGAAIATDGTIAVVGAPNAGRRAGAAYVFDLSTGEVRFELHRNVALSEGDLFGYATALSDAAIVIGAPHTTIADAHGTGAVYVFSRASGKAIERLTGARGTPDDLGVSVATHGSEYAAGAQKGPVGGRVYLSGIPIERAP